MSPATGKMHAFPMRSWLFVPSDSERKLAKVAASGADCVILDLEDSVGPQRKSIARDMAAEFASGWAGGGHKPRLFLRVNAQGTPWHDEDLAIAASPAFQGVVLPKAQGGPDVTVLDGALRVMEARNGLADGGLSILAIATETARAVFNLGTFGGASHRLCGLAWGAEDLGAALGVAQARHEDGSFTPPFAHARNMLLFGAAAAQVVPIDGIVADFRNDALLLRECGEAVRDGFQGKLAIHPAQVAVINAAFTPSAAQIATAKAVIAAFETTEAGVVALDGKMLDRPHLVAAQRLLARAAAAAA